MAQLVRVFTAVPGDPAADVTFAIATPPEVRINVEGAAAEMAAGSAYLVGGFVRDFGGGAVASLGTVTGALGDASWPAANATIIFALPAAITAVAAVGGICEVMAFLRVGAAAAGAEADFASTHFLWVSP